MKAAYLYLLSICLFIVGALWTLATGTREENRNAIAHGMAAAGSIAAVLCASFIFGSEGYRLALFSWPGLGVVEAQLDYLAAWFLLLTGLLGTAAAIYGIDYCREYYHHRLGLVTGGLNVFLLTMILVFTVNNGVAFLVAWEAMTLVSFLLVNTEWEEGANRRAAYVYLVMTQVGTAFLMAAFFVLAAYGGGFEFTRMAGAILPGNLNVVVFLLGFAGFAVKAGLVPVHIWLPEAHPAAPSHISALMSGVMIKSAVYGFCRLTLEWVGPLPLWCGLLVLAVAIITCVLAVLYALMENNIKKLLAYSSIENMGIVFLGLGAGMVFLSQGMSSLAGLAWLAALFHVFNHGLFKGLLFLGSGAVIQAVHTKDVEKLGGLIKRMPYTAVIFAIGSAAIAALPPTNGFVSEWLIFQALFSLPQAIAGVGGVLSGALLMAALGLTGALAAATFVKAFGLIFLAKPRSEVVAAAVEPGKCKLVPMAAMAMLCLVIGLIPVKVMGWLAAVINSQARLSMSALQVQDWETLIFTAGPVNTSLAMPAAAGLLLIGLAAAWGLVKWGGPRQTVRGETWTCGIIPNARMEYTATGFSKPVRVAFGSLLGFRRQKLIEYSGNPYHGQRISYDVSIRHLVNEQIYRPINARILTAAKWVRRLQNGSLRLYIGYILAVTVIALIWSGK